MFRHKVVTRIVNTIVDRAASKTAQSTRSWHGMPPMLPHDFNNLMKTKLLYEAQYRKRRNLFFGCAALGVAAVFSKKSAIENKDCHVPSAIKHQKK